MKIILRKWNEYPAEIYPGDPWILYFLGKLISFILENFIIRHSDEVK
jgi:hypothetical protein